MSHVNLKAVQLRRKIPYIPAEMLDPAPAGPPEGLAITRSAQGPIIQWGVPGSFVLERAKLQMERLPASLAGLRLLHLSDLHLGRRWGKAHDRLIEHVQSSPPDFLLFTGDFVDFRHDYRVGLPAVLRLFKQLRARHGVYAILGNHDPDLLLPHLLPLGIQFITHRRVVVDTGCGRIELIGFPGPARRDMNRDFLAALPPREPTVPRIVLSHYPDLIGFALPLEPDLYLAGHTHGGQICLPNGFAPLTHDRLPRRYCKGIHRIRKTWFAVSYGMGFTGVAFRAFCPAGVTEFELQPCEEQAPL